MQTEELLDTHHIFHLGRNGLDVLRILGIITENCYVNEDVISDEEYRPIHEATMLTLSQASPATIDF